ncbi:hypothetical protein PP175_25490 (plasmid) [Aneurinibacillus sp. Ricciae_BoGa-3]|uniref:hypothetical protein n=1 Tax=Aneurinibacillus sp. Ricciae_BoGa-3 TaxID=3022697 RepID=UPI00233FA1EC|nr:hypothetical protein [Aneurinibacillus sp. Ricciae_BoGa-3]WCK57424.1 hypothetical protein PP175_25490 [Aneurinibacillus sp. Ricciae_BoGa-3]
MLHLVPEKYQSLFEDNVWIENIKEAYLTLSMSYEITEIVPLYLEEFIRSNANDLFVGNVSKAHTDCIDVMTVESLYKYKRVDIGKSGFSLGTRYQHSIYGKYLSNVSQNTKGFSIVKLDEEDFVFQPLQRVEHSDNYNESFIFRTKAKDMKKIQCDNPSLAFLESLLTHKESQTARKNFKIINSEGELIGGAKGQNTNKVKENQNNEKRMLTMKLDIKIPSLDEMDNMSLEELKEWERKLAPYYGSRFQMNQEDYLKIMAYLSFSMMIENIESGINKWHRIAPSKMNKE